MTWKRQSKELILLRAEVRPTLPSRVIAPVRTRRLRSYLVLQGIQGHTGKTITGTDTLNNFFCGLKLGNMQDYLKSVFGAQQSHLSAKAKATLYMLAHFSKNAAAKEVPVEESR